MRSSTGWRSITIGVFLGRWARSARCNSNGLDSLPKKSEPRNAAGCGMRFPGARSPCMQAATTSALNSALCSRRRRRPSATWLEIVFTCPPELLVDTRLLCAYRNFKMGRPAAYTEVALRVCLPNPRVCEPVVLQWRGRIVDDEELAVAGAVEKRRHGFLEKQGWVVIENKRRGEPHLNHIRR